MQGVKLPSDRFKGVLCIVCLLGLVSLLPWNVFITQAEYLTVRAHQQPYNPWLADQLISLTANAYLLMNVSAFLLLLPLGKYISIQAQVVIPFALSAVIVLLQAWVAFSTHLSGNVVITVTLVCSAILGFITAAMTSSTYALATYLSPLYIQALLLGQSVAGVATSALSFITIWRTGSDAQLKPTAEDVKSAAMQYFIACAILELLGILGYFSLPYIPFVQYCAVGQGSLNDSTDEEAERLNDNTSSSPKELTAKVRRLFQRSSAKAVSAEGGTDIGLRVLSKQLKGAHYLVFLAFFVSLAAFPAMVSMLCSVSNGALHAPCFAHPNSGRFYGNLFQPFIFLLFNFGDAVGRTLPGFHADVYSPGPMFSYAAARVLLVIGIMLCNIVPTESWRLPHILWSDWWSTLLVLFLGVTNGHLNTIAFMHAPRFVAAEFRDRVGTVMSFCLTLGLGAGSLVSMLLVWLLHS